MRLEIEITVTETSDRKNTGKAALEAQLPQTTCSVFRTQKSKSLLRYKIAYGLLRTSIPKILGVSKNPSVQKNKYLR